MYAVTGMLFTLWQQGDGWRWIIDCEIETTTPNTQLVGGSCMTAGADIDLLCSYWTLAGDAEPSKREWSRIDIEDRIRTASATGFTGIGIWHADLQHISGTRSLTDLRDILDRHGITGLELEFIEDWFLDEHDTRRQAADVRREFLLEAADILDAAHVKVGDFSELHPTIEQATRAFGMLCDEAAERGTQIGLEFVARDGTLNDFENARTIVRDANRPNGGLLLDSWHLTHLGVTEDDLATLTPADITAVELNDGPLEGLGPRATVHERCYPGDGAFALDTMIRAIEAIGYRGPWGVEILSRELRQEGYEKVCEQAYVSTMKYFD